MLQSKSGMGPQSSSDSWLESLSTDRSEKDNVNRKLQTKERGDHLTESSCLYTGEIISWKKRKKDKDKSKRRQKYDAKSEDRQTDRNHLIDKIHQTDGEMKGQDQIRKYKTIKKGESSPKDSKSYKHDSGLTEKPHNSNKDVHNEKINKCTDNEAKKIMVYKRVVSPSSTEQDRLKTKNAETTSCLDSNRFADEDDDQDGDGNRRKCHQSETIVKEPCLEPVEHEEYWEKRDISKDDVLDQISNNFMTKELLLKAMDKIKKKDRIDVVEILLHLVKIGIFRMENLMAELDSITKAKKLKEKENKEDESIDDNVNVKKSEKKENDFHLKIHVCCTKDVEHDADEKKDSMKKDEKIQDLFNTENKDQMYHQKEGDEVEDQVNSGRQGDLMTFDLENEDDLKEKEDNSSEKDDDVQADELMNLKKCDIAHGCEKVDNKCESEIKLDVDALQLFTTCAEEKNYQVSEKSVCIQRHVLKSKKNRKKRLNGNIVERRYTRKKLPNKRNCTLAILVKRRRQNGRQSTGGYRSKGDNSSWNELSESDNEVHHSRGSQKSDDQEETEKEKRGRKEDDEKDRDENEVPPIQNGNHRNTEDRVSSTLGKIANFKYRRKHGHLPGGQAQLSDMLGLMLNENDRLKVPPDIFEEINLCLMTSMQVKSAGETTTCFICTHVSSLICHFGSCSMGYHQTCSVCTTLFKLIQKHVAMCGLSDSFTSEVTCPVIICVKLKRSEFATFDNAEKVWKKLKKNLARFANPDFNDDDVFMSGDSIPMGRNPSMVRHPRLSTVNRPVLESIPETGGNMTLTVSHQTMGSKILSRSEPIARKNPDGSIFINSNLPRRLQPQDDSEGALSSLPQRRVRSVTLGPVFQEISTDSTDYATADTLGQETSCHNPPDVVFDDSHSTIDTVPIFSTDARPCISSDTSGSMLNSLPPGKDESFEISIGGNEYNSIPGRVFGEEACTTSLQHGIRQEIGGERYRSLWDRSTGIPGIQDVVYGERSCLLHVARIWFNMKEENQNGKKYDHREEGVILPTFQDRLKILKMRYSKNYQWVRLSHLGSGTSGKCHLAMDFTTEFKFCIKKIHISKYEVNEVEIWSELRHPNIVQLIGTLRRGEKIYLLSEFIDGGCLTETIMMHRTMNRRLSQWTAISYLKQILEGLVYLQKKYVIHEDLKSDNILVRSGTKELVITDFGVARKLTSETDIRGATPSGSQIVFSPEKALGQGHGYKSDLWSAICVLIHMLTGYPPWVRKYPNIGALLYVIIEQQPDIPTNVSVEVADLIRKGFNKDPSLRPGPEELLHHRAFKILDGYTPDTCVSTLLPSLNQNSDTKLPSEAKDTRDDIDIVEEIVGDLKSINILNAVHVDGKDYEKTNIPTENSIEDEESNESTERILEENGSSEFRRDSKKNNSSIDIRKMAIEFGISLPENVNVKEEDTPPNLYEEFLQDSGQVTFNDQGLEELESSTEKHSSDTESNSSEVDFEVHTNSNLPNFGLILPKEETENEIRQKIKVASIVEQYHESVLTHQLSRTGSQHNQSFDSINNMESEIAGNIKESVDQLTSSSKHSLKSSIHVPCLPFFTESTSTSSDKITIIVKPDSFINQLPENTDAEKTAGSSISSVETVSSTSSPFNMAELSGKSAEQHRPESASPSIIYSIYEDDEIDDDNLFGSGEGLKLLMKHANHSKSVDHICTGEGLVKRTPIKTPNLFLDLSPATRRTIYAGGNSMSDPSTADIKEGDRSPLPPTQPYYTPQVNRPQPFVSNKSLTKPKSTSGKSPPHLEIENDTSGAWSSPRSQQEELLEKFLEELSNTSGTDIQIATDVEEHAKFDLGLEEDDEASMLYIQQQYLNDSPSTNGCCRMTVHYKPGQTFTMNISGLLVKQQWKEIIEKECSYYIHGMGASRFLLLDSNKQVLDLQKSPSQGELIVYVEDVEDTTTALWYCEAGMIM